MQNGNKLEGRFEKRVQQLATSCGTSKTCTQGGKNSLSTVADEEDLEPDWQGNFFEM